MTEENRLHGAIPGSIQLRQPTPMLAPEVTMAIDAARKSNGKWMVAVWRVDDDDLKTIHMQFSRGGSWNFDWLFRAFLQLRDQVLAAKLPISVNESDNGQKDMGSNGNPAS